MRQHVFLCNKTMCYIGCLIFLQLFFFRYCSRPNKTGPTVDVRFCLFVYSILAFSDHSIVSCFACRFCAHTHSRVLELVLRRCIVYEIVFTQTRADRNGSAFAYWSWCDSMLRLLLRRLRSDAQVNRQHRGDWTISNDPRRSSEHVAAFVRVSAKAANERNACGERTQTSYYPFRPMPCRCRRPSSSSSLLSCAQFCVRWVFV